VHGKQRGHDCQMIRCESSKLRIWFRYVSSHLWPRSGVRCAQI